MSAIKKRYTKVNNLSVSNELLNFVNKELLPGTKIKKENFIYSFLSSIRQKMQQKKK